MRHYEATNPRWVDEWLSASRFTKYLNAAGHDQIRALKLYDWNAELAAAFMQDLGHLEVGLRNACDRELSQLSVLNGQDWLSETGALKVFAPHIQGSRDTNETPRRQLRDARNRSGQRNHVKVRGKVLAEITFGFWTYLTDSRHEKTIWSETSTASSPSHGLHNVFTNGTDRAALHDSLTRVRELRNRVAHHESVFDRNPEAERRRIVHVAGLLSPELRSHLTSRSRIFDLLRRRP